MGLSAHDLIFSGCKVITLFVNRRKNLFIISVFYEIFRKRLPCSSFCCLFLLFAVRA